MSFIGNRRKGLVAVGVLGLIQSAMRFGILGVVLQNGWPATDHAVSPEMALFIDVMFLFLGLSGIVLTYGLMTGKKWGYTGTIGISVLTIVFDVWAIIAVQPTALLGLILPTVFIVYLVMRRNEFCFGLRSNERVGGVRN
jgi:hypothetical protein